MGLRGPKPKYSPDEAVARKREARRVRHWTKQGLEAPPRGLLRAEHGSQESADRAKARRRTADKAKRLRNQDRAREFVNKFKTDTGCADCGYTANPVALTFDHLDRAQKGFEISRGVTQGLPIARLMTEIAKCEVRCANCHAIRSQEHEHWREIEEWERPPAEPSLPSPS